MNLPFWKIQSVGNDFPLLHEADLPGDLPLNKLAIRICDRKFGVGGDGLLTLERISPQQFRLRMFNPDGTEDFCGNGIRCAARHAHDLKWAAESFSILHGKRSIPIRIAGKQIETQIGAASYEPADVPVEGRFEGLGERFNVPIYWNGAFQITGSALTTGSTHVVVPCEALPSDEEFEELGPLIENFPIYPLRTSVIWRKEVAENHLAIRIWERGVGETWGCGTGSSAAAVDYLRGLERGGQVRVDNPGGTVWVSAASWEAPITVEGEATEVYTGTYLWL